MFCSLPCLESSNNEDSEYKASIGLLYGIAFTIKMSKKVDRQIEGYFDYVVPPLEGLMTKWDWIPPESSSSRKCVVGKGSLGSGFPKGSTWERFSRGFFSKNIKKRCDLPALTYFHCWKSFRRINRHYTEAKHTPTRHMSCRKHLKTPRSINMLIFFIARKTDFAELTKKLASFEAK